MGRRIGRVVAWIVVAAALAYVTVAGGTDDNSATGATSATAPGPGEGEIVLEPVECATGAISGAGATFPQAIVQQWIKDFGAACPGTTVGYQAVGSGAGVQQLISGTVDFAGSDTVLKPEEEAAVGAVLHIPWTAGGIAVLYNLPELPNLRLGPQTIAGIFAGRIERWDAEEIRAENPSADLPSTPIQVVHRSDGSGTTSVFTSYLTTVAPEIWTSGAAKDVDWPVGQGAKGSDGVTAVVKQTEGAITYAEVSFGAANGLGVARVGNPAGRFVGPTPEGVTAALEDAVVPADLRVEVSFEPSNPDAYPISTTTFALVRTDGDPGRAALVRAFILYALSAGQRAAADLEYAPLPRPLAVRAQAAVYAMSSP